MNALQRIENEALNTLSNFDGEQYEGYEGYDDYEDYEGYDGYGDDFMDFDGLDKSFKNEIDANRIFTFTVEHAPSEGKPAANASFMLLGGFKSVDLSKPFGVMDGVMHEGVFNSIEGVPLKATGIQCTIDQFRRFVELNPTRVVGMKIGVTETSQIDNMLLDVEMLSPFRRLGNRQIVPSLFVNENTYRDKIVTIKQGFDYNDQIQVKTTLYAPSGTATSAKLTISYICGGILNSAKALESKAVRAVRHHGGAGRKHIFNANGVAQKHRRRLR